MFDHDLSEFQRRVVHFGKYIHDSHLKLLYCPGEIEITGVTETVSSHVSHEVCA